MKKYAQGGIFREGMKVPQDIDGGSAPAPRPKNTTGSKRKPAQSKAMGGRVYAKGGDIDGMATKGKTKGMEVKMAKGGSIDGCAMRGKTKGTMVKMAKGGKTC
jgi:hypothetical protein